MSIRRKCGSSSTMSILPIVWPLSQRLAREVCRYLNGKAYPPRFVESQHDIAAMRARDVARDRETESVAALLGSKQWLENALFFNDTATTEIYTLSLHDALPI